jgi:hypothetical protein
MITLLLSNTVKLEDVFKSTQESMNQGGGSDRALALVLGGMALAVLLLVLSQRRKHAAIPRGMNHPRKLLKEVVKVTQLKSSEMRQIQKLADEQGCGSPLTLLLCPSILARATQDKSPSERQALGRIVRKLRRSV